MKLTDRDKADYREMEGTTCKFSCFNSRKYFADRR